jgi:GcrA cell cycle regulator
MKYPLRMILQLPQHRFAVVDSNSKVIFRIADDDDAIRMAENMVLGRWRKEWDEDEVIFLRSHWNQGCSLSKIANDLGRSRSSISNKICRLGLVLGKKDISMRQSYSAHVFLNAR